MAELMNYQTGEFIRRAKQVEHTASVFAAEYDGGAGVIEVDGVACYVEQRYADSWRCGCGKWAGVLCPLRPPLKEMVVVEYTPEALRAFYITPKNVTGNFPCCDKERIVVSRDCAKSIIEADGWAEIDSEANPELYICY